MGVDISTYRSRIGAFRQGHGKDVVLIKLHLNYNECVKTIGAVSFVGLLLIMAGIEANPGPIDNSSVYCESDFIGDDSKIDAILRQIGLEDRIQLFQEHKIGVAEVELMSPDDFKDLGINQIGVRLKITKACTEFLKSKMKPGEEPVESNKTPSCINDLHEEKSNKNPHLDEVIQDKNSQEIADSNISPSNCTKELSNLDKDPNTVSYPLSETVDDVPKPTDEYIEKNENLIDRHDLDNLQHETTAETNYNTETQHKDIGKRDRLETTSANANNSYSGLSPITKTKLFHESSESTVILCDDESEDVDKLDKLKTVHSEDISNPIYESASQLYNAINAKENFKTKLDQLLNILELKKWFPNKLSLKDIVAIDIQSTDIDSHSTSSIPWKFLRKLMMTNYKARDSILDDVELRNNPANTDRDYDFDGFDNDDDAYEETCEDSKNSFCENDIVPIDAFIAIYHCCDPMLKQFLTTKLLMCRLAVPLMYSHPITYNTTVSIWPLRPVFIECKNINDTTNYECLLLNQPTKVISFARLGRPSFSKSKLMNNLMSTQKVDTFFNHDCTAGTSDRHLTASFVEAAWYFPSGDTDDLFDDVVTFINVRGDISLDFDQEKREYINKLSHFLGIIINDHELQENFDSIVKLLQPYRFVLLVIVNLGKIKPNGLNKRLRAIHRCLNPSATVQVEIQVVMTHDKGKEKNSSDICNLIHGHLKRQISRCSAKCSSESTSNNTLNDLLKPSSSLNILTDEESVECSNGVRLATKILHRIKNIKDNTRKAEITPLQCKYWHNWSNKKRQLQKTFKDIDEPEKFKQEMTKIRGEQANAISDISIQFIKIITGKIEDKETIVYFLEWINITLDDLSRTILSDLRREYNEEWKRFKELPESISEKECKQQKRRIKEIEKELVDSSFGLEHIFREVGQIYECLSALNITDSYKSMPPISKILKAFATLVSYGQPLELMDGDVTDIPKEWVHSVLKAVKDIVGVGRCLTLSVLGLQSSGKSTLLNTMFGCKFSVSAGRCTRGVNLQLIPLTKANNIPFDHVIIIDSEGIKAPEFREVEEKHNHDNELATLVIGIGDITLLNVKGENTSDMNDVLEITVHALLRIKAADPKIELRQKCILVHQNVSALSAVDKLKLGTIKMVERLDLMTKEVAHGEKLNDITAFNQVIGFDASKHVWCIPDLWQGAPPMATVNVAYSKKVNELRQSILEMAVNEKKISIKILMTFY